MRSYTKMLTYGALTIALSSGLAMVKIFEMPFGGSVTLASSAPIILFAIAYPAKWGLLTAFAFSLIQMLQNFYAPPVQTFGSFAAVVLLDYVLAFTCLGLAGVIARRFTSRTGGTIVATIGVLFGRFLCSFTSGILIWHVYAPEGMPVWLYSLGYNGLFCLGEAVVTAIAVTLILRSAHSLFPAHQKVQ